MMAAAETASLELVAAGPADIPALAAMGERLYAAEGSPARPRAEGEAAFVGMLSTIYRAVILRRAGRDLGYVLWREDADHTHIRHFYLEAEARGGGTGRAAFEQLRRDWLRADQPIYLDVMDSNPGALAFWDRMGFVRQATSHEWRPTAPGGA